MDSMEQLHHFIAFEKENTVSILDKRLHDLHPDISHFIYNPFGMTKDDILERQAHVREHILACAGLLNGRPCPGNPIWLGHTIKDDFTVDKVMLDNGGGFYITGNLYRPIGNDGPWPAIVNPHGHWVDGRFTDDSLVSVPARCAHLARSGYVAFSYDMVGMGDCFQLNHTREELEPEFIAHGLSMMSLNLQNALCVVDFLCSLPEVDPERIGCTGCSGGGTQTFLLSAVDPRIKACVPVNMISSVMEGGCYCENLAGLRIDTNNVEIAALMAPRPMKLICCSSDWTFETEKRDFPSIYETYRRLGAEGKVECITLEAEDHNYNAYAREQMYQWFAEWLPSGRPMEKERHHGLSRNELSLFAYNSPPRDVMTDEALWMSLAEQRCISAKALIASVKEGDTKAKQRLYNGLKSSLYVKLPEEKSVSVLKDDFHQWDAVGYRRFVISGEHGEYIPAVIAAQWTCEDIIIWLDSAGKQGLLEGKRLKTGVAEYLSKGIGVCGVDLFLTGQYHTPYAMAGRAAPGARKERGAPLCNFFTTYNRTDTMWRVQDILTLYSALKKMGYRNIGLYASGDAALWGLLAAPFAQWESGTLNFNSTLDDSMLSMICPAPAIIPAGGTDGLILLSREKNIHSHLVNSQ
jgi:hypothetical protein